MEFVKLLEENKQEILSLIEKEKEYNLFIIGDIYNFGFENPNVCYYGTYDKDGKLESVLIKYFASLVFYTPNEKFSVQDTAAFMESLNYDVISGKASLIEKLMPYLNGVNCRLCHIASIGRVNSFPLKESSVQVRRLLPEDAETIVNLFRKIPEFASSYNRNIQEKVQQEKISLENGDVCFGAFMDGDLIATASTSAKTPVCAMVVGVAVLPKMQKRGIGSYLVSHLCKTCLDDGMEFLSLFYDNPNAAKMYEKIGFVPTGKYAMIQKK